MSRAARSGEREDLALNTFTHALIRALEESPEIGRKTLPQ